MSVRRKAGSVSWQTRASPERQGMGDRLCPVRFVDERATGTDDSGYFCQPRSRVGQVVASAEVDDDVECRVREWQAVDVGLHHSDTVAACRNYGGRVHIDGHEARWLQASQQGIDPDTEAAPDLQYVTARRDVEQVHDEGNLGVDVHHVPPTQMSVAHSASSTGASLQLMRPPEHKGKCLRCAGR